MKTPVVPRALFVLPQMFPEGSQSLLGLKSMHPQCTENARKARLDCRPILRALPRCGQRFPPPSVKAGLPQPKPWRGRGRHEHRENRHRTAVARALHAPEGGSSAKGTDGRLKGEDGPQATGRGWGRATGWFPPHGAAMEKATGGVLTGQAQSINCSTIAVYTGEGDVEPQPEGKAVFV